MAVIKQIIQNRWEEHRAFLIDIRIVRSIDKESRKFYTGKEASEITLGVALLIGSKLSRMLGNFFIGLDRPPYPIRLFNIEEEALIWLRQLK
ncbi:MAG: hypothetical protein MAG581_02202 [Deltaproteobacteria bacterium]|nr:hypothetical protein [Deltaproteobacteria bacterium]